MMAEPHPVPEAMEVEYDSDATEPITTPEGDVEGENGAALMTVIVNRPFYIFIYRKKTN